MAWIFREEHTAGCIAVLGQLDEAVADVAALVWDISIIDIGRETSCGKRRGEEDGLDKHLVRMVIENERIEENQTNANKCKSRRRRMYSLLSPTNCAAPRLILSSLHAGRMSR